ncbi:MAG: hypothetical protein RLZZ399_877 [Verrucomicrobiota bacterium]|jgi:hypothetical protein
MAITADSVNRRLEDAGRRWRAASGARFLAAGGVGSLAQMFIFFGLDSWLHFGAAGRWLTFGSIVSTLVVSAVLAWRVWAPPISAASMARRIEQASGDRSNVLISAVQFDQSLAADSPLRAALFREMNDPFPKVQWERVFEWDRLRKLSYALIAVGVLLFAWAAIQPKGFANSALRILLPASNIQPLTRTRIDVLTPGDETTPHGRDFPMRVSLSGEIPQSAWVRFREVGGSWQRALMEHEAGQPVFTFHWKSVKQPFQYQVEAGDVVSPTYSVTVRPRTVIKQRVAEVTPPAYTGLPVSQVTDFGVLQGVLVGAKIRLNLTFNNPIEELSVATDKGESLESSPVNESEWSVVYPVKGTRTLRIDFRDRMGVSEDVSLPIAVVADEPPKVVVSQPVEGRELFSGKGSRLTVQFQATDAIGLGAVALYQSTDEKEDAKLIQEWPEAKGQKSWEATALVTLQPMADEPRVTYRVIAKDTNDVSGPGVTLSRPIVVNLRSAEAVAEEKKVTAEKIEEGLKALIGLQSRNLEETKVAMKSKTPVDLTVLVERQSQIAKAAREISAATSGIAQDVRETLQKLLEKEMTQAVVSLREATAAEGAARLEALVKAAKVEALILARLSGTPAALDEEVKRAEVERVISGVEELLKRQRDLLRETKGKGNSSVTGLAPKQDALAERVGLVKKSLEMDSKNAAIGDEDLRKRLVRVMEMIGEFKIYEGMLTAAEFLQDAKSESAQKEQIQVIAGLAKMVALLNEWQKKEAADKKEELKEKLSELNEKLRNLTDVQRDIVEKTNEMARKTELRPDDVAQMDELKKTKDLLKEAIEQMTTDLQAFPETKAGNEMKDAMMQVFENVDQADLEDALAGNLKASELAVQKEKGLLDALEKAKEISGDMEHWLSNKLDTGKWLMENFDKSEMPEIPMLALADAFEDLVGDLLQEQKGLAEEALSAASNQALAGVPPGWDVKDGVMPAFGAQGKSGNTAPKHNEQMGRSSGGREGMSDGEMAGTETQMLKGDTPDVRRTKDAMQQGQVRDNGEVGQVRATGGGKAGGFSDRNGMEGNAPVRAVQSDKKPADKLAVEQAILAEKTATKVAEANMLYVKSDGLREVSKLMAQSAQALKEGRGKDAAALHERVIRRLAELKGGVASSEVVSRATGESARVEERRSMSGNEGDAPAAYKGLVSDYFRVLAEEKNK